jgi:hypothetical protein
MLVLSRKLGEQICIGSRIQVTVLAIQKGRVRLGLGGWRGHIIQSQERPNRTYLVRWSRETLENIHPVYRERCESDDVCFDQTWLLEGDLEPDPGGLLSLEHPMISRTHAQETCPC